MNMFNVKRYKCHKEVVATPMTRGAYNFYRGWKLPENEDANDEGYLVEYLDSPDESMPKGHLNYISWSPKDTFEKGYSVIPTCRVDKLVIECEELSSKIDELSKFIKSEPFDALDGAEKILMLAQFGTMGDYSINLKCRIDLAKKPKNG